MDAAEGQFLRNRAGDQDPRLSPISRRTAAFLIQQLAAGADLERQLKTNFAPT